MQRVVVAALAVGIAFFVAFARNPGSTAGAAMPAPTQAAFQYEELGRFVLGGTPPPPGTFQQDRAAAIAAESTPAPAHGLFAGIQNTVNQAMNNAKLVQAGFLTRYTYYNNWVRTDDEAKQTAVIIKCDLHQYIQLDLAHRTYRMATSIPKESPMTSPAEAYRPGSSTQAQPGTADTTVTASRQNLGAQTIEGIPTQGQSAKFSMTTTNATGSCQNADISMSVEEYVSNIRIPRTRCPMPHRSLPASPQEWLIHQGGCSPRIHGNVSGSGDVLGSGDRLTMYRLMSITAAQANGHALQTVTEAGNVRWLGSSDAAALFEIPEGFAQQQ